MHEQPSGPPGRRRPEAGDIRGPARGDYTDFSDWDNPEDIEDAPEGYYDDEEDDGSYVPGPDDPDYDLSEAAGYSNWEPPARGAPFPNWVIVAVSILLILAILTPVLLRAR
jgi:hypothetical protein